MNKVLIIFGWWIGWVLFWKLDYLKKKAIPKMDVQLSIIIPARNEARTLPKLLASLQNQTLPPHEVIVVDDQSTDGTGEIASAYSAKVYSLKDLPIGWLGKSYACWMGAKQATGTVLLFLDADTWLTPDGLETLIAPYLTNHLDAMTVQPYHVTHRLYENLSYFFNLVIPASLGIGLPNPFNTQIKGGFGPCFLCDRTTYFSVGGHQSVAPQILEHFELSQVFRQRKKKMAHYLGKGGIEFRMYPDGLKPLLDGWSKSFLSGAGHTAILPFLCVLIWLSGCYSLIVSMGHFVSTQTLRSFLFGLLGYMAYVIQIHICGRKVGNFKFIVALCFPIPLLFYLFVFIRAVVLKLFNQPVNWKERNVANNKKGGRL